MKNIIITLAILVSYSSAHSQGFGKPDLIPPSPEAAAITKYGETPVSMFKGTPGIEIPIYNIQLKGFSMPISLSYDGSGVRVDDHASRVGLGWTLNAGGAISGTVNGLPDLDYTLPVPSGGWTGFDPIYNAGGPNADYDYAKLATEMSLDTQPDIWMYNFAGKSGKFLLDGLDVYGVPYEPWDITLDTYGDYTIVDENGHKYEFLDAESMSVMENCTGEGTDNLNVYTGAISTTRYLSKITTALGQVINFTYANTYYTYVQSKNEKTYVAAGGACQDLPDSWCETISMVTGKVLTKIDVPSKGLVIDFVATTSRLDHESTANNMNKLERIDVNIDVNSGTLLVQQFSFAQGYMYSAGYSSSSNDGHDYARLMLNKVTDIAGGEHKFSYNSTLLPNRTSNNQDHWGFFNGKSNSTLIPSFPGFSGADRSVDPAKTAAGILESIEYPTGGSTHFTYENHNWDDQGTIKIVNGGLRIKEIENRDSDGSFANRKVYEYETPLLVTTYPEYTRDHTTYKEIGIGECLWTLGSGSSIPAGNPPYNKTFGYKKVYKYDLDNTGPNGRTISTFSTDASDMYGGSYSYQDFQWAKGRLLSKVVEANVPGTGFVEVRREEFDFEMQFNTSGTATNQKDIMGLTITQTKSDPLSGLISSASHAEFEGSVLWYVSAWHYQVKKSVIETSTGVEHGTEVSYLYEGNGHTQPTKITTKPINGGSSLPYSIQELEYPRDLLLQSEFVVEMTALRDANIEVPPVRITNKTYLDSEESSLIRTTVYSDDHSTTIPMPAETQTVHYVDGVAQPTKVTGIIDYYDSDGNVLQYKANPNGVPVSYIWGYNNSLPVAQVVNATYAEATDPSHISTTELSTLGGVPTYSNVETIIEEIRDELPDAQVTSYSYDPGHGVRFVIDPSGQDTEYVYDVAGRLTRIKDTNGNITAYQEYQYQTTPELTTSVSSISANGAFEEYTISVFSNTSWSVVANGNPAWVTVWKTAGTDDEDVIIHVALNLTGSSRSATLTISDTGGNGLPDQTVTITQAAFVPELLASPGSLSFGTPVSTQSINVTSNVHWSAADNQNWITVSPTSYNGDGSVDVSVTQNTSTTARSGTVTISDQDGTGVANQTISISQDGIPETLVVSPTIMNFDSSGGNQTFTITSNAAWTIQIVYYVGSGWLSTSQISGSGNATVTATASPNTLGDADIIISTSTKSSTISVQQSNEGEDL